MNNVNLSNLFAKDFQKIINGKQTDLYILKNKQGSEVAITNYGGSIVAIMVYVLIMFITSIAMVMRLSKDVEDKK